MTVTGFKDTTGLISVFSADSICEGDSVEIFAPVSSSGYVWSLGGYTGNPLYVSPKVPTTYSVSFTDCKGNPYQASKEITVLPNDNPGFIVTPNPACTNTNVRISASGAAAGYLWVLDGITPNFVYDSTSFSAFYTDTGTYRIIFYSTSAVSGCQFADSQFLSVQLCTGINDDHSFGGFTVSPNPAGDQLTIHSSFIHSAKVVTVSIMNMLGQEKQSHTLSFGEGRGEAIDISNLPSGIYFLQMKTENGNFLRRFVKE